MQRMEAASRRQRRGPQRRSAGAVEEDMQGVGVAGGGGERVRWRQVPTTPTTPSCLHPELTSEGLLWHQQQIL